MLKTHLKLIVKLQSLLEAALILNVRNLLDRERILDTLEYRYISMRNFSINFKDNPYTLCLGVAFDIL